ncbi:DUF883 family protein [Pseudooceanicola aestuarii]|uniref:DUF883 family protein n=1 Tax=Pseudooceanicola aestuarii TaxID=2697319 RepID=UPI0013D25AD2|nr:DUF883 family protein [Pseudooceanicola aestuarii]
MAQAQKTASNASAAKAHDPSQDDIQAQLKVLQAEVANLTQVLGDYGRAQTGELKSFATERARKLRADAEAGVKLTEAQVRDAYSDAETAVRNNPGTAVAIASGVGFLIGLIASRR